MAETFAQAVHALHHAAAPAERAAANAWLVAFADSAEAPALCEAVLSMPAAGEPVLVFAAGVVASSAARLGAGAAAPLLRHFANVASRLAAARLHVADVEVHRPLIRGSLGFFAKIAWSQEKKGLLRLQNRKKERRNGRH